MSIEARRACLATLVLCSLSISFAHAQDAAERQAQRERIRQERAAVEAQFTRQEAACYQRFVVTSCVDDARQLRRAALAELQRQEAVLDQAERRERAANKLQQLDQRRADRLEQDDQKALERAQREANADAAPKETPSRQQQNERQRQDKQQEAAQRQRSQERRQQEAQARSPAEREADEAQARARLTLKLEDATKRREEMQRRAADPARKAASGLPVPP